MPLSPQGLDVKRKAEAMKASFMAVMALCALKTSRVTRKLKTKVLNSNKFAQIAGMCPSKKLIGIGQRKKNNKVGKEHVHAEWGDGGIWQKAILMGDKCQPLEFSGVIYYDSKGNQMEEAPLRSPRASPMPAGYIKK